MHVLARLAVTLAALIAPACSDAREPDPRALPVPRESAGGPQWEPRRPESSVSPQELLNFYRSENDPRPPAPRHDCETLEGGEDLMRELSRIAVEGDAGALRMLATQDMRYGLQSGQFDFGKAEFLEDLARNPDGIRKTLARNVALGCGVGEQDTIVLPWFATTTPPTRSRFGSVLVIGEAVPLFHSSREPQPLPRLAGWEWAQMLSGTHSVFEPLQQVRLADGVIGWIDPDRVRSIWTDRWVFERRDGEWRLVAVVDEWDARRSLD